MDVLQPQRDHLNTLFARLGKTHWTIHPVDRVYLQGADQLHDVPGDSDWLCVEPMLLVTERRYAWTFDTTPLCKIPANMYSRAGFEYLGFTPEMATICWEAYARTNSASRMPKPGHHPTFLSIALSHLRTRWSAAWDVRFHNPATPCQVVPAGHFTGADSATVNAHCAAEMGSFFGLHREAALELYQIFKDWTPILEGSFDFDISDNLGLVIAQGIVEPTVVFELIMKPRFWLLHRIRIASIWRAEKWMAGPNGAALVSLLEELNLSARAHTEPGDQVPMHMQACIFSRAVRLFKDVELDFGLQAWTMYLDNMLNAVPNDWVPAVVTEINQSLKEWKDSREPSWFQTPPAEIQLFYAYQGLVENTWRNIRLMYLWNMA